LSLIKIVTFTAGFSIFGKTFSYKKISVNVAGNISYRLPFFCEGRYVERTISGKELQNKILRFPGDLKVAWILFKIIVKERISPHPPAFEPGSFIRIYQLPGQNVDGRHEATKFMIYHISVHIRDELIEQSCSIPFLQLIDIKSFNTL